MENNALKFTGIVALDENNAMGANGQLLWHIPEDMKFFREKTIGHPVLMGRKTWEGFKRPLPLRQNIVLTRQRDYQAEGAIVIHEWQELYNLSLIDSEVYVIGGGEIFSMMLPEMSRIYLTRVKGTYEGADTYWPIPTFIPIGVPFYKTQVGNTEKVDFLCYDIYPSESFRYT